MAITISGSTGIAGVDGSASTPAVQGTDTNTGIVFPAADTVSVATGGTEHMRVDSSGNVGIGTSSPTQRLDVRSSGDNIINSQSTGTIQSAIVRIVGRQSSVDEEWNVVAAGSGLGSSALRFVRGVWTGTPSAIITSTGDFQFNSGYGSVATAYGCRAWVNFNGTGVVAIRASGNVTSITDNGTGEYTLNFTTALPDANYSIVGSCGTGAAGNDDFNLTTNFNAAPTTTAARVGSQRANSGTATDAAYISVAIFR